MDWRFGLALVLSAGVWVLWFSVISPILWPPPPAIASLAPTSGPGTGGYPFTVTGIRFKAGATVQWGTEVLKGLTITATKITGTVPAGVDGERVKVRVTNPEKTWAEVLFEYKAGAVVGGPDQPGTPTQPGQPTPPDGPQQPAKPPVQPGEQPRPPPKFPRTGEQPHRVVTLGDPTTGNGTMIVQCTSWGGAVESVTLPRFQNAERSGPYVPLRVFQGRVEAAGDHPPLTRPRPPMLLRLRGADKQTDVAHVEWEVVDGDGTDGSVAFAYETGDGLRFMKRFTLVATAAPAEDAEPAAVAAAHMVRVEVTLENVDPANRREVEFELEGAAGIVREGGIYVPEQSALTAVQHPDEPESVETHTTRSFKTTEAPRAIGDGRLRWAAVTNAYFVAAVRPGDEATNPRVVTVLPVYPSDEVRKSRDQAPAAGAVRTTADILKPAAKQLAVTVRHEGVELLPTEAGKTKTFTYELYVGPKEKKILSAAGLDAARGGGWFDPISQLLLVVLKGFHWVFRSWGFSVVLLTLLVRLGLHPLSFRMQRSLAVYGQKMKELQPKIERIKKQFKDVQRQRQEQMKLMQEAGMRPPLGCLLLFVQFPIFIAVYRVFLQSVELRQQGFLWIDDLAQPDHMVALPFHFTLPCLCMPSGLAFDHINFLPLVWMVMMQVNQKFSVQRMEDMTEQQAQQMKMMRFITPVFGLMFWNVPAAAAIYVICSTAFGMGESYFIRKKLAAMGLKPGAHAPSPMG